MTLTHSNDLQSWFKARYEKMEASSLMGREAWRSQVLFIRDRFHLPLVQKYDDRKANPVLVVATHTSKSCELPVYYIKADNGIELWLRGNFYDWKISVKSPVAVPDNFFRLFEREGTHLTQNAVYFEGFDKNWVFGSYAQNPCEFSVELPYGNEWAFTFAFLLAEGVRAALGQGHGVDHNNVRGGVLPNPFH